MLFEINSNNNDMENIAFEYFNLPKMDMDMNPKYDNILSPSMGLMYGNLYKDEYKPYKNYIPRKLKADNEQERMLLKIQELDFAINDLSLKLDVNPNDYELYELFKKYAKEYKDMCEEYSKKYEALELVKDTNGSYTWYKNPWPWDGGKKYV